MNRQTSRKNLLLFGIDLIAVLLAYGARYRGGFGSDTLGYITDPVFRNRTLFEDARFLASAVNTALYKLGFVMTDHYAVCFLVFILCIAGAVYLTQRTLLPCFCPEEGCSRDGCRSPEKGCSRDDCRSPEDGYSPDSAVKASGLIAATLLPLVNVLFTEHFMFTECFISFGLAYFLAACAVKLLAVKLPAGKAVSRGRCAGAFILLLASSMCYQNALIFAGMVLGTYLVLADSLVFTKKLFCRALLTEAAVLGVGALNLFGGRLLSLLGFFPAIKKEIGGMTAGERLGRIFSELPLLFKTSLQLMPALWLPLLMVLLCIAVSVFCLVRARQGGKLLTWLLFLLMESLLFFAIPVLSGSGLTPRVSFTFYALIGMLFVMTLYIAGGYGRQTSAELTAVAAVLFLTVQALFCNVIWNSCSMVNRQEILDARMIVTQIEHYEEETGNEVLYLSYVPDAHQPHHFADIHYTRDQIGERTMPLAMYSLLEYVTGRVFESAEMDEEVYETYFRDRDWDGLDLSQQLVIRGDTAYFCIY